jgi:hypothetical protein
MSGVLADPVLWTVFFHGQTAPLRNVDHVESFGHGQPVVRRTAWLLLQTLLQKIKGWLQSPIHAHQVLKIYQENYRLRWLL